MIIFFVLLTKFIFLQELAGKVIVVSFPTTWKLNAKQKREVCTDGQEGSSEDWDEEKLKEVVEKKHAEADKKKTKTDIVIAIYYLSKSHDLIVFVFRFANTFWTP